MRLNSGIVTQDGTTRVKKGTLVDTVTTDAKGIAKSKQLYGQADAEHAVSQNAGIFG